MKKTSKPTPCKAVVTFIDLVDKHGYRSWELRLKSTGPFSIEEFKRIHQECIEGTGTVRLTIEPTEPD